MADLRCGRLQLWLILDRPDLAADKELAKHVLHVHRHCAHPAMGFTPLPPADLRAYVALARRKNPHMPRELTEYVAAAYAELRQEEARARNPEPGTPNPEPRTRNPEAAAAG